MGCCGSSASNDNNDFLVIDLPDINKQITHIILMGDSVLDNFYWLKDKKLDIEQQCWNTFGNKVKITNIAVDETQTCHILNGISPNFMYRRAREKENMSSYPITYNNDNKNDDEKIGGGSGGKVYPLYLMKEYIKCGDINISDIDLSKQIKPTIVLSVGGNDARIHLAKLASITGGSNDIIKALKNDNFIENYKQIVDTLVNQFKCNVILVLPYQIQSIHMIYGYKSKVKELLKVMNFGFNEICQIAQKYNLPIIDLSRTFDPTNDKHYGTSPIEPSNISGQFIVDLIQYILEKYHFNDLNVKSMVFYGVKKGNNIKTEINNKSYLNQNIYLNAIKHRNQQLQLI